MPTARAGSGRRPAIPAPAATSRLRCTPSRSRRRATGPGAIPRSRRSGNGQLTRPAVPAIPGLADFAGTAFHSAEWRHDHDLTGRRVAVVGTGASAIQFVPHVAGRAARTTVFQIDAPQ